MRPYNVEQVIYFLCWDTSSNVGATGETHSGSPTLTLKWTKDGTAANFTNTATEVDATNQPGVYKITLTAAETQCISGLLSGKSSTADVVVVPTHVSFVRLPNVDAGANGGLPTVDANNRIAGIQGTKTTFDDLNDVDAATVNAQCDTAILDAGIVADIATVDTVVDSISAAVAALNDLSAAEVNAEVDTALADIGLDHLISAAVADLDVADNSIVAMLVSKSPTASWASYEHTTESLQALWDNLGAAPSAELSAVPAATASIRDMVQFAYQALRNRTRGTSSGLEIANDAGTVIGTASISQSATEVIVGKFT